MQQTRQFGWIKILAVSAALGMSAPAIGYDFESALEYCTNLADESERLDCFDSLGRQLKSMNAKSAGSEPPATAAMVDDVAPAVATQQETAEEATPDIGGAQVEARNRTRTEALAELESASGLTVASYRTVPYQRLLVTLENGQVWRQIKGDTQRINVDLQKNQTVDINESSISGYRMRLNQIRRTIRVERLK